MEVAVLELCCGWKSVSNAMEEECGWDVTTLDVTPKFKPTILADIRQWDYRRYFESATAPDIIWASPPCRTFTVQAWGRHRSKSGIATSNDGEGGDACVRACLECIEHCLALNPKLIYFVENPLYGAFRKLPCVLPYMQSGNYRALQYGDYAPETHSLKPTLVLTNCAHWRPRPITATKSTTHWNTLSKKQRTVIPRALCREVAAAAAVQLLS